MSKKLTTLLLLGLMLALPLRAAAGLAMFGCMPNQQAASFISIEHSGAGPMQDMPRCHEAEQLPSDIHKNCHQDHGSNDNHAANTCSSCGDCCVGALSIPAMAQIVLGYQASSTVIIFLDHPYTGFHPEGPEHPPRHALS